MEREKCNRVPYEICVCIWINGLLKVMMTWFMPKFYCRKSVHIPSLGIWIIDQTAYICSENVFNAHLFVRRTANVNFCIKFLSEPGKEKQSWKNKSKFVVFKLFVVNQIKFWSHMPHKKVGWHSQILWVCC